jgi:hypothetical protein
VPAHDRVGRDDGGDSVEKSATQLLPLRSEASLLVVRQPKLPPLELLFEDAVLLEEVLDGALLLSVDPAGER